MELAYIFGTSQHCYLTLKGTVAKNKTGHGHQLQAGIIKNTNRSCCVVEATSSNPVSSLNLRVVGCQGQMIACPGLPSSTGLLAHSLSGPMILGTHRISCQLECGWTQWP